MAHDDLEMVIENKPSKETLDVIDNGLDVYNAQFAPAEYSEFVMALKNASGEVKGGIYAIVWAEMLFIKWFWIDEAYRRQGRGRALMDATEAEGRRRGCRAAYLDTFEFQARPFYEKLGYQLFGTLDYPTGFKRFYLQKPL